MTPSRRPAVDSEDDFFAQPEAWTWYKHEVLGKYLRVWLYKLGSRHELLYFVDGFAGAGTYGDGSPGSPVIAAQWNDHELQSGRHIRVRVIACEQDPAAAARLRAALAPWSTTSPPLATVYEAPFHEVVGEILEQTRAAPSLFFIDPFSILDVSLDRLAPILDDRREAPTELLFRIDPGLLARLTGWLHERDRPTAQQQAAQTMRHHLERFGLDADELELALERSGIQPHKMVLLDRYLVALERRFRYVQLLPVRGKFDSAPRYFLVHCTDSPHGAAHMNDIVSTTEDDLFERSDSSAALGQGNLFEGGLPRRRDATVAMAEAELLAQLEERDSLTWIELRADLSLRLGPDLREKDHKRALMNLVAANRVEITGGELDPNSVIRLRRAT